MSATPILQIVELVYSIEHADDVNYQPSANLQIVVGEFKSALAQGAARFESLQCHYSIEAARAVLEPAIRAWELGAELKYGRTVLRFVYQHGAFQAPPGSGRLVSQAGAVSAKGHVAKLTMGLAQYPAPPCTPLLVDEVVEVMLLHYRSLRQPQAFLSAHAYAIATFTALVHKNQASLAQTALKLEAGFIAHLKKRATEIGSLAQQRKATGKIAPKAPLSDNERAMLVAVCRELVLRTAQYKAGSVTEPLLGKDSIP